MGFIPVKDTFYLNVLSVLYAIARVEEIDKRPYDSRAV